MYNSQSKPTQRTIEPTFIRRFSLKEHTKNVEEEDWLEASREQIKDEIEQLLNTRQVFSQEDQQVDKSVLDFGIRDFSLVDLNSSSMKLNLKKHIELQILKYVGRIESVQVLLKHFDENNVRQLKIHIEAKIRNLGEIETMVYQAGHSETKTSFVVREVE